MTKRRLAVALLLLLPLLALVAPGRALAEEPAADPAPARSAVAEARTRGELRWGNDSQGGAPYVFQDPMDPNHLIGFEVDFAAALAKKLGVRARPVQGQWDGLLALLARGDFDVVINGIEVDFADSTRLITDAFEEQRRP